MVAYSFKKQFVEPIRAGRKSQTIRNERKRDVRVGEAMQLYCGMRTRSCFLIGRATCRNVEPIGIDVSRHALAIGGKAPIEDAAWLDAFARQDGFHDWKEMRAFWIREHDLGVHGRWWGVLISWTDFALA